MLTGLLKLAGIQELTLKLIVTVDFPCVHSWRNISHEKKSGTWAEWHSCEAKGLIPDALHCSSGLISYAKRLTERARANETPKRICPRSVMAEGYTNQLVRSWIGILFLYEASQAAIRSLRASLRWSCYLKHVMRKFDTFQLRASDCRGLISVWWWWVWNVSARVVLTTTVNESCNNTWVYAVDSALRWKKWRS